MSSLLAIAFRDNQRGTSHEHRQCIAFSPHNKESVCRNFWLRRFFFFQTLGNHHTPGNQQGIVFIPPCVTTEVHSYKLNSNCLLFLGLRHLHKLCIWDKEKCSPCSVAAVLGPWGNKQFPTSQNKWEQSPCCQHHSFKCCPHLSDEHHSSTASRWLWLVFGRRRERRPPAQRTRDPCWTLQLLWWELAHTIAPLQWDLQTPTLLYLSQQYWPMAAPVRPPAQSRTIPSTGSRQSRLCWATWLQAELQDERAAWRSLWSWRCLWSSAAEWSPITGAQQPQEPLCGVQGWEKKLAAAFSLLSSCHVKGQLNRLFLELNRWFLQQQKSKIFQSHSLAIVHELLTWVGKQGEPEEAQQ